MLNANEEKVLKYLLDKRKGTGSKNILFKGDEVANFATHIGISIKEIYAIIEELKIKKCIANSSRNGFDNHCTEIKCELTDEGLFYFENKTKEEEIKAKEERQEQISLEQFNTTTSLSKWAIIIAGLSLLIDLFQLL